MHKLKKKTISPKYQLQQKNAAKPEPLNSPKATFAIQKLAPILVVFEKFLHYFCQSTIIQLKGKQLPYLIEEKTTLKKM